MGTETCSNLKLSQYVVLLIKNNPQYGDGNISTLYLYSFTNAQIDKKIIPSTGTENLHFRSIQSPLDFYIKKFLVWGRKLPFPPIKIEGINYLVDKKITPSTGTETCVFMVVVLLSHLCDKKIPSTGTETINQFYSACLNT